MANWWQEFWVWLQALQGGAPAVVGSAAGSALGLLSIVIGALLNAELNRRRDSRLRKQEVVGLLTASIAEIENLAENLKRNFTSVGKPNGDVLILDPANQLLILPKITQQLSALPPDAIKAIANSYVVIDQYSDHLIHLGGTPLPDLPKDRIVIQVPHASFDRAKSISNGLLVKLDDYLATMKDALTALQRR
ncbi:hypothetical protein [Neorhizobium sp. DT-125]|uniref:hypothetical protein n=1 Tax=Neorhizobium sp. DT-125 TaxID=3396163 RepID=UPI003F1C4A54